MAPPTRSLALAVLFACSVAAMLAGLSKYAAACAAAYDVAVEPRELLGWAVLGHALPLLLREPGAASTLAILSVRSPLWRVLFDGLVVGGGHITCTLANGDGVPWLEAEGTDGTVPLPLAWTGAPWARSIDMQMELALPITHGAVLEALRYVAPWLLSAHFEVSSGVGTGDTCDSREGEGGGDPHRRECARGRRGALLKLDGRLSYPGLAAGPNDQESYHATARLEPGSLVVAATPLSPQEVAAARKQRVAASAKKRAGTAAAYGLARLFGQSELETQLKAALDAHDAHDESVVHGEVDYSKRPQFSVVWSSVHGVYNGSHVMVAGRQDGRLDVGLGVAIIGDVGDGSGTQSGEMARTGFRVGIWNVVVDAVTGSVQAISVGIPLADVPAVPATLRNETLVVDLKDGAPDLTSLPTRLGCMAAQGWTRAEGGGDARGEVHGDASGGDATGRPGEAKGEADVAGVLGQLARAGARALVSKASASVCQRESLTAPPTPLLPGW